MLHGAPSVRPSEDGASVRRRNERYQEAYRTRHDRSATAAPMWRDGDWDRVRKPVSGRIEDQQSMHVSRRTGSVSYRLATGERVHARRLVPSRPGDGER